MRRFHVDIIKPSHYDDDGYVLQWWKAWIPSNSMACLYAIAADCARRRTLGDDVEIVVNAYDEMTMRVPMEQIARRHKAPGSAGIVCLVGVQSNQYPRAMEMARRLRAEDLAVAIGGFHVSGCVSMLKDLPSDLQDAVDLGITLYAGEAEERFEAFLADAWKGTLKPVYNYMNDLPGLQNQVPPLLPAEIVHKYEGSISSFDAGRGCPFQCSFCTIINVQGRKSRYRTPDDIEAIIRKNAAQNIRRFFITDDDFARNKNWEPILDRMIKLREQDGLKFKVVLQVDTLSYRLPGFIEKAARAGCSRVFIGLENIDPDALAAAKKRQNKIWEYRKMLQAWKDAGVITYAGYILGFPDDTPEKIARNIEIIKREMPLDLIEFFILTPLPGSEDHKVLHGKGAWMDPDLNKYDLNHRVTHHPLMSDEAWDQAYLDAWRQFYTPSHVETVLRRDAARGRRTTALYSSMVHFLGAITIEGVHPLECGVLRRKVRSQRRHGMRLENPIVFYPRRALSALVSIARWARLFLKFRPAWKGVINDRNAAAYTDLALSPANAEEEAGMDIIQVFKDHIPRTHGAPLQIAK
jgi:pyruvate-formate lyase-activating enzyme